MSGAGPPCTVVEVSSESAFSQEVSSLPAETLVVIYFHAPWAAPCKQMSAVVSALASTYKQTSPPQIVFHSVHAEDVPEISEQYDVAQVPYVVLQKAGKIIETISGSDAAKLRTAVETHTGIPSQQKSTQLPPLQQVTQQSHEPATNGTSGTNGTINNEELTETSKEELNTRLSELVKAAPVMLFMKGTPHQPQCGFSRQTVALLRGRNIKYGFFNILADDEVRQGLKEFSDWPTFPQLYVDGELVGGLDIVREEFENDPEFLDRYSVKPQAAAAA